MTSSPTGSLNCHLCQAPLNVKLGKTRKAGKPCLSIWCSADGKHVRVFVMDKAYIQALTDRLEAVADDGVKA